MSTVHQLGPAFNLQKSQVFFSLYFIEVDENLKKEWKRDKMRFPETDVFFYSTNFSKPFSLAVGGVTVQLFPGLIPELTLCQAGAQFTKCSYQETAERAFYSVCFTSDEYRITETKIKTASSFIQSQIEQANTRCIYPLKAGSGLQLNFNTWIYKRPMLFDQFGIPMPNDPKKIWRPFKKDSTIHMILSPKMTVNYKLVILLNRERHNPRSDSLDSLSEFVKSELNNPAAKLVRNSSLLVEGVDGAVLFESEFKFSNETLKFISESCNPNYRSNLFTLAGGLTYWAMRHWPTALRLFWDGSNCPVQTGLQLQTENDPINVELSFTNQNQTDS